MEGAGIECVEAKIYEDKNLDVLKGYLKQKKTGFPYITLKVGSSLNGKIATKDDITQSTGIPIPMNIRDFLFDGWFEEILPKIDDIEFKHDLSDFDVLAPIPNPNKIICLAFNYKDHAEEQKLTPPKEPAIVNKPRTALNGTNAEIICPNFVKELDYEIELALIIGKKCKNISEEEAMNVLDVVIDSMQEIFHLGGFGSESPVKEETNESN